MLLGCDYLDPIRGVGPKKALKLIQEHETLERVLDHLHLTSAKKENPPSDGNDEEVSSKKRAGAIQVPDIWPFQEARSLFQSPEVLDGHNIQVRTLAHYLTRQAQVGPAQDRRASIFPMRRKRIWRGARAPELRKIIARRWPEATGTFGWFLFHSAKTTSTVCTYVNQAQSCV